MLSNKTFLVILMHRSIFNLSKAKVKEKIGKVGSYKRHLHLNVPYLLGFTLYHSSLKKTFKMYHPTGDCIFFGHFCIRETSMVMERHLGWLASLSAGKSDIVPKVVRLWFSLALSLFVSIVAAAACAVRENMRKAGNPACTVQGQSGKTFSKMR